MNTRDLKYLVAVAELGHFGKAAEACFVSQPALSMQIMKLEESLGVQLFERTNKSVLLTDHGAVIVERAKAILNQIEEMREIAKTAKNPYVGELRIGVFPTLAPYLLPLIIPALSTLYPQLSFYLIEEQTAALVEKLKTGKLHAAFLATPISENYFRHTVLFDEAFLLAVPAKDSLAKLKKVSKTDLEDKNLLLLEEGHCLRDQALNLCHRMQTVENKNFKATSLETLRQMVAAGVGMTLMPALACTPNSGIAYIPFATEKPMRTIALYHRPDTAKEIVLAEIVTKIKSLLAKTSLLQVR